MVEHNMPRRVAGQHAVSHGGEAHIPSEREKRLEVLLRSTLPYINLSMLSSTIRNGIMREFVEMRFAQTPYHGEIGFTVEGHMQPGCKYALDRISSDAGAGYIMSVPEEEAGFAYILAVPSRPLLDRIRDGSICMRAAILAPECLLYTAGSISGDLKAYPLHGSLPECCLPEEGVFVERYLASSIEEASTLAQEMPGM